MADGALELSAPGGSSAREQVNWFRMIWHLICVARRMSMGVSVPWPMTRRHSSRYGVQRRGSVFLYVAQVLMVVFPVSIFFT